jgi:GNAT superfamily N-acetyltransferase
MNTAATQSVRRATLDDLDVLVRFRYAFRAEDQPIVELEAAFGERCAEWMRPRLGAHSHWHVWIVERRNEPIGNVWVQIVEKIPNPGPEPELHAYLSNFFVRAGARNSGAGSALLEAALADCRTLRIDSVFLWPTANSRPLYERHGFRATEDLLVSRL